MEEDKTKEILALFKMNRASQQDLEDVRDFEFRGNGLCLEEDEQVHSSTN